jgi:hypothetical protein
MHFGDCFIWKIARARVRPHHWKAIALKYLFGDRHSVALTCLRILPMARYDNGQKPSTKRKHLNVSAAEEVGHWVVEPWVPVRYPCTLP